MTMKYSINFFNFLRHFPLHSLVAPIVALGSWLTAGGSFWAMGDGSAWAASSGESRHLAWIKSMLAPLQSLNARLVDLVEGFRYRMLHTGQVVYLEHYLNDLFDPVLQRIYIDDDTPTLPVHLFNKADGLDLTLYNNADGEPPLYIFNAADFDSQFDFVVMVPAAILLTPIFQDQVRAAVGRYKQAGKRFKIENF